MQSSSWPERFSLTSRWRAIIGTSVALLLVLILWPSSDSHPLHSEYFKKLGIASSQIMDKMPASLPDWVRPAKNHYDDVYDKSQIWPGSKPDTEEYVAICLAVKDQAEDLKEFFRHHYYHLGIRRFYIMDDRSSPSLDSVEDYTVPRSALTFRYWTPETRYGGATQQHLYDECQSRFGHLHTWIGYIDADEYIEIVSSPGQSMASFLRAYETPSPSPSSPGIGAFGISWIVHNSNGQLTRQNSTRAAYTSCIYDGPSPDGVRSDNQHIKSFVQTKYYVGPATVHHFALNESRITVGENGDEITSHLRVPVTRDKIALHHYTLKSREEWEEKMSRGNAQDNPRGWEWWDKYENSERVDCPGLANYYP